MNAGGRDGPAPRHQLLVLRHAKAEWGDEAARDQDRCLTARGHRAAARMGRWLVENGLRPDLVCCSPAVRTRQTAEAVVGALGTPDAAVQFDDRIYEATLADLLKVLHHVPEACTTALLIGHNPGLESLVLRLASQAPHLPSDGRLFPTAALAHFAFDGPWAQLSAGGARLVALVRPRELSDD